MYVGYITHLLSSLLVWTIYCDDRLSLINRPQNDIYDNTVEESIPTTNSESSLRDKALQAWDLLNLNTDRNRQGAVSPQDVDRQRSYLRGPPGPAGPRGPPGAAMTREDLLKEFKKMIKSAAAKRAKRIISEQCPDCNAQVVDNDVLSLYYPGVEDKVKTVTRSAVVFTAQLLEEQKVHPQNSLLLSDFQLSGSTFGVIRGAAADTGLDGKFFATQSGIYQFTASINIHSSHQVKTNNSKRNYVQLLLCPNGLCRPDEKHKHLVVPQFTHSMESRQRFFTIQLITQLKLNKDDYVTLHLLNQSKRILKVQQGSTLSGIMLSV